MGFQGQNTTLILSKSKILQFISMQEVEREILIWFITKLQAVVLFRDD